MKSQIELAKEKGIEVGCRVRYVEKGKEGGSRLWDRHVIAISDLGIAIEGYTDYIPVQSLEKVEEVVLPEVASWDADRVHISVHMTKREYFAAMAMQGLVGIAGDAGAQAVVCAAVIYADALIAELNKGEGV